MQQLINKLSNLNVDAKITELEAEVNRLKGTKDLKKLDNTVKELKIYRGLKESGVSPLDAFTSMAIPVIPSQYRSPIQLPNNSFYNPDINVLMKNLGEVNDAYKELRDELPDDAKEKAKKLLYKAVEDIQGLETPEINHQVMKNYFGDFSGSPSSPKTGYFQQHLTRKRADLTGRSVISPNPTLDMDQVEIPIDMGLKMFSPFIQKELVNRGYTPDEAKKQIDGKTSLAINALHREGKVRPVLINRAPSIAEGSVTSHWPTFVDKLNVNIPNVIAQYVKGDFDGDTMSIHVPVSNKSIQEAINMMPSHTIYDEVADNITAFPDHAAATGIYLLSKTPAGRKRINALLPDGNKVNEPINKGHMRKILLDIAKSDSQKAANSVNELRKLGDSYAYDTGFSYGLSDIEPLKDIRDKSMGLIKSEISALGLTPDTNKLRDIYRKHSESMTKDIENHYKPLDNPFGDILVSRSRGNPSQIRDIVSTPIYVASGEVLTKPIKHSYAEGLTPGEYYLASQGARSGVIARSQGTAMPGALGKEILATLNTLVVNSDRHDSMNVINLPVSKPSDLIDRYIGEDVTDGKEILFHKDTPIDMRIIQIAKKKGLSSMPVYTPLQSSSEDGGLPGMSYGIVKGNKLPDVGYNIGAHSALGLVSPLFTESMGAFHTGGSLEDKNKGYPRLKQVMELTKSIANKATLAEVSGKIDNITEDSLKGFYVYIDGEPHYTYPGSKLKVSVGDTVKKGEPLCDGPIDPREIANLKDLSSAQEYMVNEIINNVPGNMRRRAAEVIVEGITRHGQIVDPGDTDYLPGDYALLSEINAKNTNADNKATFDHVFKGVNTLPQATQSWMSQLNFRNIKRVLTNAISEGKSTNIHSFEPAPALARSIEFGEGEDGRY